MRIQIIAEGSTKIDRALKQWGLSILVDGDVLFDTFCDAELLKSHFQKYQIDVKAIRHVVISHEHWDHTGGLWWVLENNKHLTTYVCAHVSDHFKDKIKDCGSALVEVTNSIRIKENIFTTGEIQGAYDNRPIFEQSLILVQHDKLAVITGCSHPGILTILVRVGLLYKNEIDMILGGLHLVDAAREDLVKITTMLDSIYKVKTFAPFHCTGRTALAYFRKIMPERTVTVRPGDCFHFNAANLSWEKLKLGAL